MGQGNCQSSGHAAKQNEQFGGILMTFKKLPLWLSWQRIHLQCGRPGFDAWVGKIPWRRERLYTPGFWPGEFHGLYSPWGHKVSDTTEQLSFSKKHKPRVLPTPCWHLKHRGCLVIGSREERKKTQWDFIAHSVVKNPPSKTGKVGPILG